MQGGSEWRQQLLGLSLVSVATNQPEGWDAQYNEPFTLLIDTGQEPALELFAYLQDVDKGRLSFAVEHVDRENIEPLQTLLRAHMADPAVLDEELRRLGQR
ncbi:PilZ domain-containing protein [Kineobactrum salinum]|uniref:PilZ domain-containing protein n=1 Tax=Kineobactrum salinum TaxID=2708301 RepID=A0A6C0U6N6_9GAMM|nr:PilZ domain-containing protein [Kineobactrum salinum]